MSGSALLEEEFDAFSKALQASLEAPPESSLAEICLFKIESLTIEIDSLLKTVEEEIEKPRK